MAKNDGKKYERFVKRLQDAIHASEQITGQKNIEIELNKKLVDTCGLKREFDLYWEYELEGITYKTVIECKDWIDPIGLEKIDAIIGKVHDLPGVVPIFATKTGYQSGAKIKAESHGIELLIVREANDDDWKDKEGNPLIKEIGVTIHVLSHARITNFNPILDGHWITENTDIDPSQLSNVNINFNDDAIEDLENDERYSLLELFEKLDHSHNKEEFGQFTISKEFTDAYIYYDRLKLKLASYTVQYTVAPPVVISMDIYNEMLGVIEYLQKGSKSAIFTNKVITDL